MPRVAAVVLLLLCDSGHAASDIPGSADPLGLARFPHSWIVEYEQDDAVLVRELIVGRVDKTRRDVRTEGKIRTAARLQSATYRIPGGTPRQEVVDHYLNLLGGDTLFSCHGRDCGRSNHWANHIFRQAKLYGPDVNQFYLAARYDGQLVGAYVIERGNKRVYAHLLVIAPTEPDGGPRAGVVAQLQRNGFAVVPNVVPLADGRLTAGAEAALAALGAELAGAAQAGRALAQVYLVCHIYGASGAARMLTAAQRCAERAAELAAVPDGPELLPFAAGPMLPRPPAESRLELVLPPQLHEG